MLNRANNGVPVRRLWIITLCWFVPALGSLVIAAVFFANKRPPLVRSVPFRPISATRVVADSGPMNSIRLEGTVEFVNEAPALLHARVRDKLITMDLPCQVDVFRDGESFAALDTSSVMSCPLPEGRYAYRVVAYSNITTMGSPPSACELTVRVEYPQSLSPAPALGLLGAGFLLMGAYQWKRARKQSKGGVMV